MENRMEGTLRAFSHDMRTPLNNVIALVTLSLERLREEARGEAESVAPYLRKVLVAARDMERLTDDLLKGETAGCTERFTAQELGESVSAAVGAQAAQKRQLLCIDVRDLGRDELAGDGAALRRILMNLMSNAVKYTQEGGTIRLTAAGRESADGAIMAEFIVEDNGMGMDAAFLSRMYEPMARSKQAIESAIAGNGLGLTIVRRLTERMNGTIDVKSEPGKGTQFTLRIPLCLCGREKTASLAGKRFLLAEDNDLSAEIAQEILNGAGASVSLAANGAQAVERFLAQPEGTFDAVVLDMHMPEMDGCAAAKTIRGIPRPDAARIPIFALTAGGEKQDEADALASGMNACLRKPLDLSELRKAMRL